MKHNSILWILKRIRCRIPALCIMTAANAGHAMLCVFFALGSKAVIDSAVAGGYEGFVRACIWQGAIIVGILICLTVMRHLKERLLADLERDWKRHLLHGVLHGEYACVAGYHSAELLNRMNKDVEKVNTGILALIPGLTSMATRLVAAIIVLGSLDTAFTLVLGALGAVSVLTTGVLRKYLKQLSKQVSEHDGKVSGFLQEIIEKLLMVQAMNAAQEVEQRADVLLEQRYLVQRRKKNVSLLANTGVSTLFYGCGFLALVWCSHQMLRGEMSFGTLTAVIQLVSQLQTPFVNLSGLMPQYFAMVASAERLMELEEIPQEQEASEEDPDGLYQQMETIQGENLVFSYDRDQIFQGADFCLPKGSFAVLTGQSGKGKSTLLKLLLGMFRSEGGILCLNCAEQRIPVDRRTRRLFAYVPQGNLLLSGTLRENLTLGNPHADQEALEQAIYASAMDEFLPQLPLGLETMLGENGTGLSEGQGQRLAIARAVLGGAPILLLDECTSALDTQTEEKVLQRLRQLPDRTCIAVTHRPAALALCDCRLEIDGGKIQMLPKPD